LDKISIIVQSIPARGVKDMMDILMQGGIALAAFAGAVGVASLVEYWVHRLMHQPYRLGERHRDHHRRNEGQGVLWEFRDYLLGTVIVMVIPFFWSVLVGCFWALGGIAYAAFSAYAHQLQHENPRKCFWMKMPVHYVHHKYGMWHHNFGLGVDWWDHVFGTYKPVEWLDDGEINRPDRGYLQLRWF
jgi:sterol desaturase/sphingolipid hydroxylase (fatty acid hydroxylase superfamily)